jgi:hypothetical protein
VNWIRDTRVDPLRRPADRFNRARSALGAVSAALAAGRRGR